MERSDDQEGGKLVEYVVNHINGGLKIEKNVQNPVKTGPPDGGARAWCVVGGSFLINGFLFGIINTFGSINKMLSDGFLANGYTNAETISSGIGSVTLGTTFLLSPISGLLSSALGLRRTAFLGGVLAAVGLLLSSFFLHNPYVVYITYSVMYGCGASLAYTPSLAILGHYFDKHLGVVNGIVSAGSSVFTVIIAQFYEFLIKNNCNAATIIRIASAITFCVSLCSLIFKPIPMITSVPKTGKMVFKTFDIWKNKKYAIWALALPSALFGYFVPYAFLAKYVDQEFPDSSSMKAYPVICISITSFIGRLLFGYLGDRPKLNRIFLQQVAFYVIGALIMIYAAVNSFTQLIIVSLGVGLFDGAFISLLGPIAFDLVGESRAAQAIGCLLGLASIPVSVGTPIAAKIKDYTGSYRVPFAVAGIPAIVGATIMMSIHLVKIKPTDNKKVEFTNGKVKTGKDIEESQPIAS